MAKQKYNAVAPTTTRVDTLEEVTETTTEKRTLEKVVTVQPQKVKRGLLGRLFTGVMGPDGASGIGEYVNEEIIKPAIKNIIVDAVTSGINMIMYGDRGGVSRGPNRTNYSNSSRQYGSVTQQHTTNTSRYTRHQPEPVQARVETRPRHGVEEYRIVDRADAVHVLVALTENAEIYGHVSVADYYELIGVASVYTDNDHGWRADSIARATIVPVRGGYIIRFPQVEVI